MYAYGCSSPLGHLSSSLSVGAKEAGGGAEEKGDDDDFDG